MPLASYATTTSVAYVGPSEPLTNLRLQPFIALHPWEDSLKLRNQES